MIAVLSAALATARQSGGYTRLVTGPAFGPIPGRASPVAGLTNETVPAFDAIATVWPSGLIAAAVGAAGGGVIVTELRRRSECASKTVIVRPSTTALARPHRSGRLRAPPRSIRLVHSSRPLGSDQRVR